MKLSLIALPLIAAGTVIVLLSLVPATPIGIFVGGFVAFYIVFIGVLFR